MLLSSRRPPRLCPRLLNDPFYKGGQGFVLPAAPRTILLDRAEGLAYIRALIVYVDLLI